MSGISKTKSDSPNVFKPHDTSDFVPIEPYNKAYSTPIQPTVKYIIFYILNDLIY